MNNSWTSIEQVMDIHGQVTNKMWTSHEQVMSKTEVESVQLGFTYIADMDKYPQDKCCPDKCRGDSCNLLYMFPGPFV